mgnify:CR=1 FL=1
MKEVESLIEWARRYLTGIFPNEMGTELNRAFEKRQMGDYEYTFVISRAEAEEILENGEKFVERIAQYLKEETHVNS